MNVYTWMMLLVLLLSVLMRGNRKGNLKYILLACLLMFCVMGLRDVFVIGSDVPGSYRHFFKHITETSWADFKSERRLDDNPLFWYLVKIMYDLTNGDYQLFIAIVSGFIMISFAHFINRYSVSPVQSFVYYWGLLLYVFAFDALKQAIAMSILLYAFDAIIDRKVGKYLILVGIASLFHFPALIFLPAYWMQYMRINAGYLVLLALALMLTYIFRDRLLNAMLDTYASNGENEVSIAGTTFFSTKALVMVGIIVAAVIIRPPTQEDRLYFITLQLVGFSIVFQTFCTYSNIFERLAYYYFQFSVILLPMLFEEKKLKKKYFSDSTLRLIHQFGPYVFGAYGLWRFADYLQSVGNLYLPFVFYFENTVSHIL